MLPLDYESCWCSGLSRGGIPSCGRSRWASSKTSPGVNFNPLCSWGCPRPVVLGQTVLEPTAWWWCQAGRSLRLRPAQPRAGKYWPGCRAAGGGKLLPGACGSLGRAEQELPGRILQPREQAAGLGQAPGLFLRSKKRGRREHPADGGTGSLHLTCLI